MTRINGIAQQAQRIFVPEYPRQKINTPLFRACCNSFLLKRGLPIGDSLLGIKRQRDVASNKQTNQLTHAVK